MAHMSVTVRLNVPVDDDVLERLDKLSLRYPLISRSRVAGEALRLGITALGTPSGALMPIAAGT